MSLFWINIHLECCNDSQAGEVVPVRKGTLYNLLVQLSVMLDKLQVRPSSGANGDGNSVFPCLGDAVQPVSGDIRANPAAMHWIS